MAGGFPFRRGQRKQTWMSLKKALFRARRDCRERPPTVAPRAQQMSAGCSQSRLVLKTRTSRGCGGTRARSENLGVVDIQWTGRGPLAGRKDGWSKTSDTDRFKNTSRGQHDTRNRYLGRQSKSGGELLSTYMCVILRDVSIIASNEHFSCGRCPTLKTIFHVRDADP